MRRWDFQVLLQLLQKRKMKIRRWFVSFKLNFEHRNFLNKFQFLLILLKDHLKVLIFFLTILAGWLSSFQKWTRYPIETNKVKLNINLCDHQFEFQPSCHSSFVAMATATALLQMLHLASLNSQLLLNALSLQCSLLLFSFLFRFESTSISQEKWLSWCYEQI